MKLFKELTVGDKVYVYDGEKRTEDEVLEFEIFKPFESLNPDYIELKIRLKNTGILSYQDILTEGVVYKDSYVIVATDYSIIDACILAANMEREKIARGINSIFGGYFASKNDIGPHYLGG